MSVHEDRKRRVVAATASAPSRTQAVWVKFCQDYGTDALLPGLSADHRLRHLELFGKLYSNGAIS